MNDNTILRIKVPAHLYESVKEQLTLTEAKNKPHYGAGMEVVKEKKMSVPKDGMKKVEEANTEIKEEDNKMEKKDRTLDELKAAKAKLDKKIEEMETTNKNVEENISEYYGIDPKMDIVTLLAGAAVPVITAIIAAGPKNVGNALYAAAKEALAKKKKGGNATEPAV
jgi:hypothetical protein